MLQVMILCMRSGNALYGDDAVVNALRANCDTLDIVKRVDERFGKLLDSIQSPFDYFI